MAVCALDQDRLAVDLELDVFDGELSPLTVAEVEFPTVEEAEAFTPPDWFGREVTYDKRYSNANMTINGRPETL